MTEASSLTPEFVELMPSELESGVLYVSMVYGTAIHRCACGCGEKVVTPFSPTGWKLLFDGESLSLNPSIGNWSFKCQSHYWIDHNHIRWAPKWPAEQIEANRAHDRTAKRQSSVDLSAFPTPAAEETYRGGSAITRLWRGFIRRFVK